MSRGICARFSSNKADEALADQPAAGVNDIVVWTVNEYVLGQEEVDLAARVPSQLLIRGWFRWKEARDYLKDAPLVARVHANGQMFGGGVTMSALYRGENGMDEAAFLDLNGATERPSIFGFRSNCRRRSRTRRCCATAMRSWNGNSLLLSI